MYAVLFVRVGNEMAVATKRRRAVGAVEQFGEIASRVPKRERHRQKHYRHEYHDGGGNVYRLWVECAERGVLFMADYVLHSGGRTRCRKYRVAIGRRPRAKKMPKLEIKKTVQPAESKRISAPVIVSLCLVCAFAVANGFVKDGINTWTPNLLFEVYHIESHYSIILTLLLPLVSIFGAYLAKLAYKKIPNDVLLIGIFFALGGGLIALILWLYTHTLFGTVALFAVVSCVIAAVNNLITAAIPFRLRTVGRSGFFAGILNTFCYAGSTLTSFLLGALADRSGWNAVILLLMCALLCLSCVALIVSRYWKKKIVPLL